MTLRKFGTEHGGAAINPEDPQGLSKTALNQLAEGPEEDEAYDGPAEEQIARREERGRVTGIRRADGSVARPGEGV